MSQQTMLMRTSQLERAVELLPALAHPELEPCISPSPPSPKDRFFACRGMGNDASHRKLWSTHSLLLQPEGWQATERRRLLCGSNGVLIYRCPSDKCFHKRHPSRIFPVFPSVTRFGACPAPCGASMFCFALPPQQVKCGPAGGPGISCALRVWVSKEKISLRLRPKVRARFLSSEPPQKAHLGTWERGTSRRFAQECPEGNPGKYKQEK